MTALRTCVVAVSRVAGMDLVRLRGVRHAIGRRARLMESLGIDVVIDVGANQGQFALEVRRAGYEGEIVSIEALAAPFEHLSRRAAGDKKWTAIRSAVGPRTDSTTIHVAANGGASSSVLPMLALHERMAPFAQVVAEERVEVAALDSLLASHLPEDATVFLKADVQGYELQVLAGATGTLARAGLVQLEMSLMPLYEAAPTYRDVLDFMSEREFRLVGIETGFAAPTGLLLQADGLFAPESALRRLQELRP